MPESSRFRAAPSPNPENFNRVPPEVPPNPPPPELPEPNPKLWEDDFNGNLVCCFGILCWWCSLCEWPVTWPEVAAEVAPLPAATTADSEVAWSGTEEVPWSAVCEVPTLEGACACDVGCKFIRLISLRVFPPPKMAELPPKILRFSGRGTVGVFFRWSLRCFRNRRRNTTRR